MSRGPGNDLVGPDGNLTTLPAAAPSQGAANGISSYFMPQSALLGVFLTDDLPTLLAPPAALSFANSGVGNLIDFSNLSPELQQVFYIGDGLDTTSAVQSFVVPTGQHACFLERRTSLAGTTTKAGLRRR